MSKPHGTRRNKPAKKRASAKGDPHRPTRQSTQASSGSMSRDRTKGARIVEMLRSPAGATIAAMMSAIGWQSHSIRGFLAGTVRKRLKLNLVSETTDNGRVYRVKDHKPPTAKSDHTRAA